MMMLTMVTSDYDHDYDDDADDDVIFVVFLLLLDTFTKLRDHVAGEPRTYIYSYTLWFLSPQT